jgi:hypothetical protein
VCACVRGLVGGFRVDDSNPLSHRFMKDTEPGGFVERKTPLSLECACSSNSSRGNKCEFSRSWEEIRI